MVGRGGNTGDHTLTHRTMATTKACLQVGIITTVVSTDIKGVATLAAVVPKPPNIVKRGWCMHTLPPQSRCRRTLITTYPTQGRARRA